MSATQVPVGSTARARVSATSANLGPGYDTAGLALGLFDELTAVAEPAGAGLSIEVDGHGVDSLPRDDAHLVARSLRAGLTALGTAAPDLTLTCVNRIPHGRGLGSSSAAIIGGLLLARGLAAGGAATLDDADVVRIATEIEGHPDNVAPALLGGFTIAWIADGIGRAVRAEPHPDIRAVAWIPETELPTARARQALPREVPFADATHNVSRASLLVHAMTRDPALLFEATDDRLHQQYRRSSYPESWALVEALRADGHAAFVSGAGPTVLVLAAGDPGTLAVPTSGFEVLPLELERRRRREGHVRK